MRFRRRSCRLPSHRRITGVNKIPAGICGFCSARSAFINSSSATLAPVWSWLLVTILTCGIAGVVTHLIGLIEGIIYLCKSDEEFVRTYVDGRKEWF